MICEARSAVGNRFGESPVSRFDYTNDSLARRTNRVDNLSVTNDFGYNIRSEVVSADMGANDYRYAYDPIGNRLTATNNGTGWNYLSNPLNQGKLGVVFGHRTKSIEHPGCV